MTRVLPWMVLLGGACASAIAVAAQSEAKAPGSAVKISRQLVEQKEALVKRVLFDSPAVRRIEASGNNDAKQYLAGAQDSYRKAVISIRSADLAGADMQLNHATRLISEARQLAPDEHMRSLEQHARYTQLLKSVESLRLSYQKYLQRANVQPRGDAHLPRVTRLVDTAKSLAASDQLTRANSALGEAEQVLMAGISQVLGSKTIEYAQRFETADEEYLHEHERNRSYADLISIALAEFKPGSAAIREVQRFVDTNRQLREQAERHAARKEHRAGVAALRSGTSHLQSALAAAGLRVPQDEKPQRSQ